MTVKKTIQRQIHFDKKAIKQLEELKAIWDLNNSETIRRCLDMAIIHAMKYSVSEEGEDNEYEV